MTKDKGLFVFLSVVGVIAPVVTLNPALILTPYINDNRVEEARNLSLVDSKLFLNVTSYSGFFTVDKKYNSNVFFWYFPVPEKVVKDTPWIIWLQGGPGATSMVGLFDEMGPFEYNNGELKYRNTTWCSEYSMVFIDNPVGAGFSFTDDMDGLPRDMETYANHLFSTIQQFLKIFPELKKAPLYIAGSSYAGRYVPALATKIYEADPNEYNLQGLILGNPALEREAIMDYTSVFYQWGIIDQQGVLAAKPLQDEYNAAIHNGQSELAVDLRNKLLDKLADISYQNNMYNALKDDVNDLELFVEYITKPEIREAIHVGDLGFTFSNASIHKSLAPDFLAKVTPKIETLLDHYRILIYCGQLDMMAPCVGSAALRRRAWRWRGRSAFLAAPRTPWWQQHRLLGYVKSGGGLTEVLIRDAGHIAPIDKPAEVKQLVLYFIQGLQLQSPPNYQLSAEDLPEYRDLEAEETSNAGLIVSIFMNVLLVLCVITLVLWFLTWKRKNDALFIPLREDIFNVA
ncbi:venom serine carboxypeptidase-like [Epargyreus clarus]|uniref:venom serine carboxypeptidase-like n=1 Tax=Epargyreus clarus TaxID=520877 RepID=UPI003C2C5733